jgi:PAS domain-containing protein
MLVNENRLNLADARARQYLARQMEQFFFGDGADHDDLRQAPGAARKAAPCTARRTVAATGVSGLNLEPAPRLWRERLARWDVAASALVRLAALGMAAMLLTYAGQLGLTLSPWSPMALPAGLAIAAASRWSYAAGAAAALGTCTALISTGVAPVHALLGAALVGLVPVPAQALLRLLGFDPRLERPADVLALALSVLVAGAFPAALLVAIWLDGHAAMAFLPALLIGWVVLGLGMLATAVAVLALDRGVLQAMQPGNAWLAPLASALAVAAMIWLLWVAPTLGGHLAPVALFFPLLVVTMLALRDQLALAAGGLLAAALLATGQSNSGIWLWAGTGGEGIALASWLAAALALMLASHAALVSWHERSQRWEWALDGSRLGVADWHLLRRDSFASAAWRSLTGHNARHWEVQAWRDQVHAEDRGLLDGAIAALTAGVDGRRQLELRMPHGDGWRWLEATLLVIERDHTGAAGAPAGHAGRRRRAAPGARAPAHVGQPVPAPARRPADHRRRPARAGRQPGLHADHGRAARAELLGTVPSLLRPTPADPLARQQRAAMWAGLRDQGSWRGELLERRRSGEFCTLQATISTVRGPGRRICATTCWSSPTSRSSSSSANSSNARRTSTNSPACPTARACRSCSTTPCAPPTATATCWWCVTSTWTASSR